MLAFHTTVRPFGLALSVALGALLTFAPLADAQSVSTRPVAFSPDRAETALDGTLNGQNSVQYTFRAEAGQTIEMKLSPIQAGISWSLYAPGDLPGRDTPILSGKGDDQVSSAKLTSSGLHILHVIPEKWVTDERTYRLTLRISGTADPVVPTQQDPAAQPAATAPTQTAPTSTAENTLSPGGGWWEVTGVSQALNMREMPSTTATVMTALPLGARLRDEGCMATDGRSWCKVTAPDGRVGWVAASFLRRADGPNATPPVSRGAASTAPAAAPAATATQTGTSPAPRPTPSAGTQTGWYTVTGVARDLNLRAAPSTSAPVLGRAAKGARLKGFNCESAEGREWCQVEAGGVTGWAAADFLVAAQAASPSVAPVQGAKTGTLPCSTGYGIATTMCDYSVVRSGSGAVLTVAWPNSAGSRKLLIDRDAIIDRDGQTVESRGQLFVVTVGDERYEVPVAALK